MGLNDIRSEILKSILLAEDANCAGILSGYTELPQRVKGESTCQAEYFIFMLAELHFTFDFIKKLSFWSHYMVCYCC